MWKQEFKRNFFNIKTIIIILILICMGSLSFYYSYQQKTMLIETQQEKPEDVNLENLAKIIEGTNGIQFNIDYMLISDFFEISIIILVLFCGIFLSSSMAEMIDKGQVNQILSRTSYKKYVENMLISQSLYIATIVSISMIINTIIGYIIGGIGNGLAMVGEFEFGFGIFILISIIQIFITSMFLILVNGISMLSSFFIKKKLIIQCLPFFVFLLLPLLISSTIGNIFRLLGEVTSYFVPFRNLTGIYWILQYKFDPLEIFSVILPYIIYTIILFVIYKVNVKKLSEDCI